MGTRFADSGLCGASADAGVFRFHDAISGPVGQDFLDATFAKDGVVAEVFAYDWLGRQFAVSPNLSQTGERSEGEQTVAVFSPFDMGITPWVEADRFLEALEYDIAAEFLQAGLFSLWMRQEGLGSLPLDRCAGATVPGFYRGSLELSNLANDDLDVYLTFSAELWNTARSAPPGSAPPRLRYEG